MSICFHNVVASKMSGYQSSFKCYACYCCFQNWLQSMAINLCGYTVQLTDSTAKCAVTCSFSVFWQRAMPRNSTACDATFWDVCSTLYNNGLMELHILNFLSPLFLHNVITWSSIYCVWILKLSHMVWHRNGTWYS